MSRVYPSLIAAQQAVLQGVDDNKAPANTQERCNGVPKVTGALLGFTGVCVKQSMMLYSNKLVNSMSENLFAAEISKR